MQGVKLLLLIFPFFFCQCNQPQEPPKMMASMDTTIDENKALEIAKADAQIVYRDLDQLYNVVINDQDTVWKVAYILKDEYRNGGGPSYEISKDDGVIVWKIYEQ